MEKPYQIEAQRAVKRLQGMAAEGNPAVQMVLPMAEMLGWLRQGVGELVREAGLQLMSLLMEEEVRQLMGALAVLALAAAIAGYLPARRAACMNPIAALRNE